MKTNKFIFGSWFSTASILDINLPEYLTHQSDSTKYMEFFYIWYLYIRNFLPKDYHIYITDNGSPKSIDWFLQKIKEPFEILKDSISIDFSKKIHIKKFEGKLSHRPGWGRVWNDWLNTCAKTDIDLFFISTDALIAYDVTKDTEYMDFLCTKFSRHDHDQTLCFIKNFVFKNNFLGHANIDLYFSWLYQQHLDIQNEYNTERGMRKICETLEKDKIKEMSQLDLFIHAPRIEELELFILKNNINDLSDEDKDFINNFISAVKYKKI